MTNQELFALISQFDRSGVHTLKWSQGEFSIELNKGPAGAIPTSPSSLAPAPVPPAEPSPAVSGKAITAPLVGTFYAAPAPDQPPYVSVGDRVAKGQTLCLMEAMKMMSEVPAPCDCVIAEVCKANGELAEFGEPLFRYQPC